LDVDDRGEVGKRIISYFSLGSEDKFLKVLCLKLKFDEPLASVTSGSSKQGKLFNLRI
jgi:hypothetical protein